MNILLYMYKYTENNYLKFRRETNNTFFIRQSKGSSF